MRSEKTRKMTISNRTRGLLLLIASVSLGLLSACSKVQHEVISNKQATAESLSKSYGVTEGAPAGPRSLWNLNYKRVN